MAQWEMNLTSIHEDRTQVQSLASLSGLRTWCCHELCCRSQMRLRSGVAVAMVQADGYILIRPPDWERPYAKGGALKRKKS